MPCCLGDLHKRTLEWEITVTMFYLPVENTYLSRVGPGSFNAQKQVRPRSGVRGFQCLNTLSSRLLYNRVSISTTHTC